MKYLLEELQRIYDELKDKNEINIIKKYGIYAKLYTTVFMRKTNAIDFYGCSEILISISYIPKYSMRARVCKFSARVTDFIFCLVIAMSIVLTSAVHILWPSILNIFLPRNLSRYPSLLLVTEYFIDKERYLYLILLHTHMALISGWFSMIATGAILVAYLQHVCGLFQIVR